MILATHRYPAVLARLLTVALAVAVVSNGASADMSMMKTRPAIAAFAAIDTDKDNKLDRHELRAAADRDFGRLDIDRDGFLTPTELAKTHDTTLLLPLPGRLSSSRAFAAADTDKDGRIDKHEYETVIVAAYMGCDRNHDGTIELSDLRRCSR